MDTVFEYKEKLTIYLLNINNLEKTTISFKDFLYIILSNNSKEDLHLKEIIKKIIPLFEKENVTCNISSLKALINYTNLSGLDEETNKRIYDYLLLDQIINKKINEGFDLNYLKPIIEQQLLAKNELIKSFTK